MENLDIYRASAGSGKTHLLTQNFLKLAFENPNNFTKILAVTFTNKAAEEMKTRIVEEINEIIQVGSKSLHFSGIQEHLNNKPESEIVEIATKIRDNILHNYSMFSVSTIDSFVQKVIRAFSFEINVGANYALELDSNKVVAELTEMLYEQISENKKLQKWLIKFAEYKINEGKAWDFRTEIGNLSHQIFTEQFQSIESLNNGKNDKTKLEDLLSEIMKIKRAFEGEMVEVSEKAKAILKSAGIENPASLGAKFKSIANHLTNKITDKKFEPVKTVVTALDGIENWHAKTAKSEITSVIYAIYDKLYPCLEKAINIYNEQYDKYLSAQVIIQNFHSFGILSDIASLLPQYRFDNNVLLISDTTLLLKEIIGNNDAPFIYEKIGNKFKHILIDEFQDTSGFQWANFRPLIENSLSEAFFNLIVGDIKQSIYRWRGGDWKLLLNTVKQDIGEAQTSEKSLDTNWRSKKNIIDFNNTIFRITPELLQNQYNEELGKIGDKEILEEMKSQKYDSILTDAYKDNFQKLPNGDGKKGGRVKINFISDGDFNEEIQTQLPETINNLLKNKNYEPRDIAILVRTNLQGKQVVDSILDYQENVVGAINYPLISADSLFISNSNFVQILISAMKFLNDERNKIELTKLIYENHFLSKNSVEDIDELFTAFEDDDLSKYLPAELLENKFLLRKKSLYELSEELIKIFKLYLKETSYPYIRAFQDVILDYLNNETSDLSEFLNWWDTKGITKSIRLSDMQNAVKILTIHKSKGLAFNVVLLPYANWGIDHNSMKAPLMWAETQEAPFNTFEFLPVKYSSKLTNTIFRKDYFDEKLYAYMDAINMLYVAFTRPKTELIIFAPKKKEIKKISKISDLLYLAINAVPKSFSEGEYTYRSLKHNLEISSNIFDCKEDYNEIDGEKFKKTVIEKGFSIDSYPNNDWSEKLKINYHSDDFFIESIEAIAEKVNYGTLMHKIFARIETVKDADNVIIEMYNAGYITSSEKSELKNKIDVIISRPSVKDWFSGKYEIRNEDGIIKKNGELRIPDRVMIAKDEIIVVDFKFGQQRAEHHEQVQEYVSLLEEIYNRKVKGIIYYAEEDICETV